MGVKKLIEVALPLEKINAECAREKSIRHGHPSTLHLWWARRPLAAARAVIWSSLVDDPSSHPEHFPTEEDQNKERQRLFKILEDLVVWENSNNEAVLSLAKAEIMKSTDNNPPALLDPFAGGGAIPLEAQRLGLEAHAHDLNPVAVMINKAMIEIPPRFANKAPVNPDSRRLGDTGWTGTSGLAEDVRYYGEWMKQEAFKRIGHLYPKVKVPQSQGGGEATVIAWIWARTVKCPNPACECKAPLSGSFVLSQKNNKNVHIELIQNGKTFSYEVKDGKASREGTVNRTGAVCAACGTNIPFDYIRNEGKKKNIDFDLMAVVAEGNRGRIYVSPTLEQQIAASVNRSDDALNGSLPENALGFRVQNYGMTEYADLFSDRQIVALSAFADLVSEVQDVIEQDAIISGMSNDHISLSDGGQGALAYSQAIGVYLSFVIDKLTDYHSNVCTWHNKRETISHVFRRNALPWTWDFTEANPFSSSSGCFSNMLDQIIRAISELKGNVYAEALQSDAQSDCGLRGIMVSTDPPYYDNIGYADLSDFFYVWMRKSLRKTYPALFQTVLVPKIEELIATPFRHNGSMEQAKVFFENGMLLTCRQLYQYTRDDIPVTIYYAYKQSESDKNSGEQTASTGWETMLSSIVKAGFTITGTWPMSTEMSSRTRNLGSNALSSSIVLVCRKRPLDAPICTRRNFINELKRELRPALHKLQSSNIAPVDLAQSAIGPGMGVYSKYAQVLEADGTPMSVRSALKVINQELDLYFNEQDSDLDSESRFCVDLYSQIAFNEMKFGDANTLATAKNTSVSSMAHHGVVHAQKGVVRLAERTEMPAVINDGEQCIWLLCQQLTQKMAVEGIDGCAKAVADMLGTNAERAKDLAYRLYTIAERKKWAQEAYAYNSLVVSWSEIQSRAAQLQAAIPEQLKLNGF